MSVNLTPASSGHDDLERYEPRYTPQPYAPSADPLGEPAATGPQWGRYIAAIKRYKWLVPVFLVVGTAGGFAATRFIKPEYEVTATILITSETQQGRNGANESLTQAQGWQDLLKSFRIADSVVTRLSLYVQPDDEKDAAVFAGFRFHPAAKRFTPGEYTLDVEDGRYTLRDKMGFVDESGAVGDSIGRKAGFAWIPSKAAIGKDRAIDFTVVTPREASYDLLTRMNSQLADKSPVIRLSLVGTRAQRPEETLNAMLGEFVKVATELKKLELVQRANTLNAQLDATSARLGQTEGDLERYRTGIITLPSEAGTPIIPGIEATRDPVFKNYFDQKYELDALARDRAEIDRVARAVSSGPVDVNVVNRLLSIPTVTSDPGAKPLTQTLEELNGRQVQLRFLRETYTDEHQKVKDEQARIALLQRQTLPQQLSAYLSSVRSREAALSQNIASATGELRAIPSRTIREGQLKRDQQIASEQYVRLQQMAQEANMAVASAVPDVKVLDNAVTPLKPTSNTTPSILLAAIFGSIGAALGLALLLDRVDRRFRYPEQATQELGLHILGAVPVVDQGERRQTPEQVAQIVESFRSIRMNVRYAHLPNPSNPQGGIALTVTSPGPDDGKSLISSNLALSFAEGGWRTVLIDGDTRRGQLHNTFNVTQKPGLLEYLEGASLLGEVLYDTSHENLTIIPCGMRRRRGPELLSTPRMSQLVASLSSEYDVVIVDSPPLGAGTDAYALGMACGQIAIVLRCGKTDRKMAQAKLDALRQLPLNILGAVLNGVETTGIYQYYSYDPEYALIEDDTDAPRLAASTADDDRI
jgi:succinoglycan biosynthesis transport protein ExoP